MKRFGLDEILDVLVIGAGPAALGVLHDAKQRGLRAVAIDKGPVCGALLQHPTYMRWFSTRDKLELAGFPVQTTEKNPTRQEYLQYCRAFTNYFGLEVVTYHEVTSVIPLDGIFRVEAKDLFGRPFAWRAKNVVVSTGFYDSPRPLDVPGEDLPHVSHRYSEAHMYADHDLVIIGAGSSAAEVALETWRAGARVTVVMRSEKFHTKYWVEPDIENRIAEGSIACYRSAEVTEIGMDSVTFRSAAGEESSVPTDFVLAMTGYEPDTTMLERTGAVIDHDTGKPQLTEQFETTVPGLYVAGTLIAGCDANVVFVENSREHGPIIIEHILGRRHAARATTN